MDGWLQALVDFIARHPHWAGLLVFVTAMAESIAEYLASRPHRKPLVVHRCGNFHCDHGLGTVSRLLQRMPLLQLSIVSMASTPNMDKPDLKKHLHKAHYLVLVPEMPSLPSSINCELGRVLRQVEDWA